MTNELRFKVERSERNARNNHYTIEAKYNERFDCFIITYMIGKNVEYETVCQSIEDVKADVTRRIEEGYGKRRTDLIYRY